MPPMSFPPILLYFAAGLTLALVVGIVCYYAAGLSATPLLSSLFGERGGPMWGRLFRISLVCVALVGGLSTKFYGCSGPTDYAATAKDRHTMLALTSEQVAGSLSYSMQYLVLAAAVGALTFGIYGAAGRRKID
jgi:hypothetical protein